MKMRLLALTLCLLLCLAPGAMAGGGDATLFARLGDDSPSAQAICVHEGALYMIGDDGLYAYRAGDAAPAKVADLIDTPFIVDEAGNLTVQAGAPLSPNWLYSAGGVLYGLNTYAGCFGAVEIGPQASLKAPITLSWEGLHESYAPFLNNTALDGDTLYASGESGNYFHQTLVAVNVRDGSYVEIEGGEHIALAGYGPGRLLLICRDGYGAPPRLVAFAPESGKSELLYEFADAEALPFGPAYDEQTGAIYWVDAGRLYSFLPGGAPEVVNYLPVEGSEASAFVLPGGYYACKTYDGVYVRCVDPAQTPRRVLTVLGFQDNYNFINRFAAAHPEAPVAVRESYVDDIAAQLLRGDSDVDVYGISTTDPSFAALRERGYLYDLSASELIRSTAADAPENISGLLTRDGQTLAVPCDLTGQCWVYNLDVLNKLGLSERDLPGDWPALLRFIEEWPQTYGAKHPELSPFGLNTRASGEIKPGLLAAFFEAYLADCALAGRTLSFDTPQFRAVIEAFERIDLRPYQIDEAQYERAVEADPSGEFVETGLLEISWNEFQRRSWQGTDVKPLGLAISACGQPVYSGSLQVLIVNPNSKNLDLALQFVEGFCADMDPVLKLNVSATYDEPRENPYYRESLSSVQAAIAEAEEALKTCAEAERPQYEAYLLQYQEDLSQVEAERYAIDQAQIAAYRARQGRICFDFTRALSGQGIEEIQSDMLRFLQGEQSSEQMIANLEQKARMIRMEGY